MKIANFQMFQAELQIPLSGGKFFWNTVGQITMIYNEFNNPTYYLLIVNK